MGEPVTDMLERIGNPVAARIDALLSAEVDRWNSLDASLSEPLTALRSFVRAGGKRLRPAFCHWAFVGAGGDPLDPVIIDAGAALEMLHTFALVHDDVMDDSLVRRGADAVHVQFRKEHERSSLTGEARRYGEAVAVLVGDMAFVYADKLMQSASHTAIDVFTELRVELNVGQYLDVSATARSDATLPMARKIAQFKSGKYTVERPLHLGAALAGRFEDLADGLSAYGIPVGEAFQLRDDILGAFGDAEVTGKPVGGDLREGKPTALLAVARERATAADSKYLESHYGRQNISDDEVFELQRILVDTGARKYVEDSIDQLTEAGLAAVDALEITKESKEHLAALAEFMAGRDS